MILPADGEHKELVCTAGGNSIELYRRGSGVLPVLLLGGVHGDESEGYLLVERFLDALDARGLVLDAALSVFVCPRLNPDGCTANRRTNHRNVDLNRNLPTRDWDSKFSNVRYYPGSEAGSEIESRITMNLVRTIKPALIISLHSYENAMVNFNGACEDLATTIGVSNGLPPKGDIGYPTPGSLGTYAGWERQIPTITLEILRDQPPPEVWDQHHQGLKIALEYYCTHTRLDSDYTSL